MSIVITAAMTPKKKAWTIHSRTLIPARRLNSAVLRRGRNPAFSILSGSFPLRHDTNRFRARADVGSNSTTRHGIGLSPHSGSGVRPPISARTGHLLATAIEVVPASASWIGRKGAMAEKRGDD